MAEYNHDLIGACQNIQKEADILSGQNSAFKLGRQVGALDAITSPANGGVQSQLITYDEGRKVAKLEIFYDQRTKPCQIVDDVLNVCDEDGSTPARKSATVTIDNGISTPVRYFNNDDMVVLCKNQQDFIQSRLFNDLRAARERLSEKTLAFLDAGIGDIKHWDGTTTTAAYADLQLLYGTAAGEDVPQAGNYSNLLLDYQNMQLTGVPMIIGQGYFDKYMMSQKLACCNANTPYGEAVGAAGAAYFQDQAANATLGDNKIIVAPFGLVHLLTFNKNKNIGINTQTEQHITIADPDGYPFMWNLDFKWDCSAEAWKYVYSLQYSFFNTWQADSFQEEDEQSPDVSPDCDDELFGVTGIFGYQVTRDAAA